MKKRPLQAFSPNPLDYPISMSGYERDSLVAEAILAAERKGKGGGQIRPKEKGRADIRAKQKPPLKG
jgi:hypothetical protein